MSNPKQLVKSKPVGLTFNSLVASIGTVHAQLAAEAGRAVNVSLTLRNWLIGCWIARYELAGTDRAKYGQKLLTRLSTKLINSGVSRTEERELRRYHQFYQTYPQIRESLTPEFADKSGRTDGNGATRVLRCDSHRRW